MEIILEFLLEPNRLEPESSNRCASRKVVAGCALASASRGWLLRARQWLVLAAQRQNKWFFLKGVPNLQRLQQMRK